MLARAQSPRWSPRQKRLNALSRVLHREQYSHIRNPFSQEREGNNFASPRILLDERRPAVQDPLALELVRDQCGLIFGEDHRPLIVARGDSDEPTTQWLAAFVEDTNLWLVLMDALWKGSVGSAVIVLRVLGKQKDVLGDPDPETGQPTIVGKEPDGPGRYYFEVWAGEECAPVFARWDPGTLDQLDRRYFIGEDALRAQGYNVTALKEAWDKKLKSWRVGAKRMFDKAGLVGDEWCARITLTTDGETWYQPVPRYIYERQDWKDSKWEVDLDRTEVHGLGQVTAWWVRPLPVDADRFYPDGACLFEEVIDFQFRIDRTLSQTGRAFDYTGDPQMVRERGKAVGIGGAFGAPLATGGTASDLVEVDEGGEAKFIEITAEGLAVAIDTYVGTLRDIAKSAGAMSKVTPDSKSGAMPELSSVAMKMLNYAQLVLSGILRLTCAQEPVKPILQLAIRLYNDLDVALPSLEKRVSPNPDAVMEWQWPDYYEPHGQEKLFEVQSIQTAQTAGGISSETAVENYAPLFDVTDTKDELDKIEANKADQLATDVTREDAMQSVAAKYAPDDGGKPTKGVPPKK